MYYKPSYSDSLRADIQPSYKDSLTHFGILGMKWGVRRFEDKSGHLTSAGKKRYDDNPDDVDDAKMYGWQMAYEDDVIKDGKGNRLYDAVVDAPDGSKEYKQASLKYSKALAKHVSSSMLNKFGREQCDKFADFDEWPKGKTFEDRCNKLYVTDDWFG